MKQITTAFVGAGGYGNFSLELLEAYVSPEQYQLVGIIDPFVRAAPKYEWFLKHEIPLYDTLEEFYQTNRADLVVICSPIPMHASQCRTALQHGSHVLCEKPLTPFWEDAQALQQLADSRNRLLGVGFQWSFSPAMKRAKADILKGVYGAPLLFKACISWPRYDSYYQGGWKGRFRNTQEEWVLDSVVSNGLSHYLHNLFFMAGDRLEAACMPKTLWGSVYRAKEIETFDTCILKGRFPNHAEFLYLASHGGERSIDPILEYTFEKGRIFLDMNAPDATLRGELHGKDSREYGKLSTPKADAQKMRDMLDAVQGLIPLVCSAQTVLPHEKVCNAIFGQLPIYPFPSELLYRKTDPAGTFVKNLSEELLSCFEASKTPRELGCAWARENLPLNLEQATKGSIIHDRRFNVSKA